MTQYTRALPHYTVSVAPMMECTDRHFRYLLRLCSPSALLYTEMISAAAIVHGDRDRLLAFSQCEHPVALQIGGANPDTCRAAVHIAEQYGYDEYNLNVGCPSEKVQKGLFGAALMAHPQLVAKIVSAMKQVTSKPVTVKHRLGIETNYRYQDLKKFISIVQSAGADRYIVHARIAILGGLTPKQNRTVPPIQYNEVYRIKHAFKSLIIELNGEVAQIPALQAHLKKVDGLMIGRAIYRNPLLLADVERAIFGNTNFNITRSALIEKIIAYAHDCSARDIFIHPHRMLAHLSGIFHGQVGAAQWRQALHSAILQKQSLPQVIESAYATYIAQCNA